MKSIKGTITEYPAYEKVHIRNTRISSVQSFSGKPEILGANTIKLKGHIYSEKVWSTFGEVRVGDIVGLKPFNSKKNKIVMKKIIRIHNYGNGAIRLFTNKSQEILNYINEIENKDTPILLQKLLITDKKKRLTNKEKNK